MSVIEQAFPFLYGDRLDRMLASPCGRGVIRDMATREIRRALAYRKPSYYRPKNVGQIHIDNRPIRVVVRALVQVLREVTP